MQLRIPPGAGAPLGELVLLIALLSINHMKVMPQFLRSIFFWPLLLWWVFGIARAAMAFPEYGFWALRDAAHVIESLYLYVGFAMAIKVDQIERVFRWLPKILLIVGLYSLLFPLREELRDFSPTVVAAAGEARTLFFQFQSTSLTALVAVAYLLIFRPRKDGPWVVLVAAIVTGLVAMLFQSRTVYLQIFALAMVLSVTHGRAFRRGSIVICILIGALIALPELGIDMKGRLGKTVDINFVLNHIMAIAGIAGEGTEGAASGNALRAFWWGQIWREVSANPMTLLFRRRLRRATGQFPGRRRQRARAAQLLYLHRRAHRRRRPGGVPDDYHFAASRLAPRLSGMRADRLEDRPEQASRAVSLFSLHLDRGDQPGHL
ncbi:MAG: hypothetical protein QF666_06865 [Alphaproteobacteria bacterium]|nr:hypothetical protein [Alphaproteobacteria bacterium]